MDNREAPAGKLNGALVDDVTHAIGKAAEDIAKGKTPAPIQAAPPDPTKLQVMVVATDGNVVMRSSLGPMLNITVMDPEHAVAVAKLILSQAQVAFSQRVEKVA